MLVLVYVDNVLVTRSSPEPISRIKNDLKTHFKRTDSCKCVFVLGIEVIGGSDSTMKLCQQRYIDDIVKHFGMDNCEVAISLVNISSRLVASDASTKVNTPFRGAFGSLMHLMTVSCPDIAYAVVYILCFMKNSKRRVGLQSSASFAAY